MTAIHQSTASTTGNEDVPRCGCVWHAAGLGPQIPLAPWNHPLPLDRV